MEEQLTDASAQAGVGTTPVPAGGAWADLGCLVALAVLAAALHAWQIGHTEVASRDSIGYIRIAWQLEHGDWREVLPRSPQHPAYPLTVLAVSLPVRHYLHADLPAAMQLSAQLAGALAAVLLVVPMFFLGRRLFDRRVAFGACLLFQCLPASGRVMADGLSDALFLLFATSALWLALVALAGRSWAAFALTGLFGGLAYLVRPEGVLIVGATGLVLLAGQLRPASRRPWKRVLTAGAALSLAALAVMAPYMVVIRGFTVKNTPNILMHTPREHADWEGELRPQAARPEPAAWHPSAAALGSPLWAIWWVPSKELVEERLRTGDLRPPPRYGWALMAMAVELSKGFFYVVWAPALLGLWWFRGVFRRVPGAWLLPLVCLLLCAALFRVAEKMGYLSDRHLLLVILCGAYWAVAALGVLGQKLADGLARLRPALAGGRWADGRAWSLALLLGLTAVAAARTLQTLHAERAGFRTVGSWLAENTCPGDFIEDPYCWASYYAGRLFLEGRGGLPAHQPPCYYVVLEESKNRHLHLVPLFAAILHVSGKGEKKAEVIHREEVRRGKDKAEIVVYRVPGRYEWMPLPALPGASN
jgi:Dolichyl-phosphate-mannose-protein mannosyltransferase